MESGGAQHPPESCIFSQLMNVSALLSGIVVYLRYRQIEELVKNNLEIDKAVGIKNDVALWVGMGACMGLSVAANFQESAVPIVHTIGGCVYFGFAVVYFFAETNISYYVVQYAGSAHLTFLRALMTCIYVYLIFVSLVTSSSIVVWFNTDKSKYYEWSVSAEWIAATIGNMFILSYTNEFKCIYLGRPKVKYTPTERNPNLITF